MKKKLLFILLLFCSFFIITGCSNEKAKPKTKISYERAIEIFNCIKDKKEETNSNLMNYSFTLNIEFGDNKETITYIVDKTNSIVDVDVKSNVDYKNCIYAYKDDLFYSFDKGNKTYYTKSGTNGNMGIISDGLGEWNEIILNVDVVNPIFTLLFKDKIDLENSSFYSDCEGQLYCKIYKDGELLNEFFYDNNILIDGFTIIGDSKTSFKYHGEANELSFPDLNSYKLEE